MLGRLLEVRVFDLLGENLHRVLLSQSTIVLSFDGSLAGRLDKLIDPSEAQNFKYAAFLAEARLVCDWWLRLRLFELGL